MWNSFATDSPVGLRAEIITFKGGGGDEIHAFVAQPLDETPRGGIVLVHHMPGWDEFYQEFAERLARHGYNVICPDLYCRYGHGTPEDVAAKVRADGGVHDSSVVADGTAALDWLKALPTSNGKYGVIGTCSGGRHAVLVASLVPGFNAVVDLWGGNVVMAPEALTPQRPVPVIDYTKDLNVPLLGCFGNDDQSPTPEQVNQHEDELKKYGKEYELFRYDGAGHGFFYYHWPMYRQEQAMDAWERVFAFFADKLGN